MRKCERSHLAEQLASPLATRLSRVEAHTDGRWPLTCPLRWQSPLILLLKRVEHRASDESVDLGCGVHDIPEQKGWQER